MIEKSENINELAKALSAFQGDMTPPQKDSKGYGYDYASLTAVIEHSKSLLKKHGLSFTSLPNAENELTSLLIHTSGQYLMSTSQLPKAEVNKGARSNPIQDAGSAITYFRRYHFTAMLGVAVADNDAADYVAPKKHLTPDELLAIHERIDLSGTDHRQLTKHFKIDALSMLGDNYQTAINGLNKKLVIDKHKISLVKQMSTINSDYSDYTKVPLSDLYVLEYLRIKKEVEAQIIEHEESQ